MTANRNKSGNTPIRKPYLTGSVTDSTTLKSALMFFGSLMGCTLIFLILGGIAAGATSLIGTVMNVMLLLMMAVIYFYSGMSGGEAAVAQSEVMQRRLDTGREITAAERARCFHPLKGFVKALLGSLPVFLVALVFALIARRQMYIPGALPSWVTGMTSRADILQPLTVYTNSAPLSAESILRIAVRMMIMPWLSFAGLENMDALLTMERCSPILVLVPALCYGFGYMGGVRARAKVHGDIAAGKKAKARKDRAAKRRKAAAARTPEQLN